MSEPVQNPGIEDVLSSIRRLVSEDTRGGDAARTSASVSFQPDRLVLTPAQRVPETTGAAESPQAAAPEKSADTFDLKSIWRPEEQQPAQDDLPSEKPDEGADTAEAVEASSPWKNADSTLYEAAGAVSDQAVSSSSLQEKIAALEAVIGGTEDQWEPDGESADAYAGTNVEALAWEDHEQRQEAPFEEAASVEDLEPAQLAEEAVIGETLEALSSDETVLDEDTLRELVADIVREELQGALGERITRNVRKLVRREIHRALAAQDLG